MKLTTVLMLLFVGFGFAACGDDDDENGGNASGIVGTWRYDYGDGDYEVMVLNADGTGSFTEGYASVGQVNTDYFKYDYDADAGALYITWDGDDEVDLWYASLSGDKLILDGYEYTRVR